MNFLAGIVFGFLGSAHCIGMCGPLALALPHGQAARSRFLIGRVLYNLGRVIAYSFMGGIVGIFGGKILLPVFQQNLSIVVGATIVLSGLVPTVFKRLSISQAAQPLYNRVSDGIAVLMKKRSLGTLLGLGLLNGFLPCGFVYLALAGAAVSAHTLSGILFMAGFGVGTVPAMLSVALFPRVLSANVRFKLTRVLPVITVFIGALLILRGLNLGIPMVSPRFAAKTVENAKPACCPDSTDTEHSH